MILTLDDNKMCVENPFSQIQSLYNIANNNSKIIIMHALSIHIANILLLV